MALAAISSAQDYRAKVQGVVTDATQALVVGAKVTLHNDNTGVEAVKMTNDAGLYAFDFVEPGTYTVTVEQTGFNKFIQLYLPCAGPKMEIPDQIEAQLERLPQHA